MSRFQSTPPARGATPIDGYDPVRSDISIHAPREGGDPIAAVSFGCRRYFNPRPPRGGRLLRRACYHISIGFQSTPPARGATPRSPFGTPRPHISIHAPREGGDCRIAASAWSPQQFQSTPPARGATTPPGVLSYQHRISIHAPREGGDGWITGTASGLGISIHAPREGGDENGSNNGLKLGKFQSTPPARGATEHRRQITNGIGISIHAPREGGDTTIPPKKYGPHTYFNPRPPRGGRLQGSAGRKALQTISIHAPREGGDARRGRRLHQ